MLDNQNGVFFKENLRMNKESFSSLCSLLSCLSISETRFDALISLEKTIAIAVFALGSGLEYSKIADKFGVEKSTVSSLLMEFCKSVNEKMQENYLDKHLLTENFKEKVEGFEKMGLPQCAGAVGK